MKMNILEILGDVYWFDLAYDRDLWRAFVNEVMNTLLP
jgi:hypothetical protein